MPIHTKEKFFKLSFESCRWGQTSYDRVQRIIVKLWTLEINWKLSGVCSAQWQSKRMGIPGVIIIMDLALYIEKIIELGRVCRVLKMKTEKKTKLKQMNVMKF